MHRFFKEVEDENFIFLDKEDKDHAVKSLRMKPFEELIVCDGKQNDYFCRIERIEKDYLVLKVLKKEKNKAESSVFLHLYQAVPKLNKLEFIVQKAVELGVCSITPIVTKNCVATITEKNMERKMQRLQKIAKQAACQSGRGIIPSIGNVLNFSQAIEETKKYDLNILFYEYGKVRLNSIDLERKKSIGILIGSEGGFLENEILYAKDNGVVIGSLGNRILRCETAPICAVSLIMYLTGNL